MQRRRTKAQEGMMVAVPATDGKGFLIGVVARVEPSRSLGASILVYFFAPRWCSIPTYEQVGLLAPETALSVIHTGVRRISEGKWPVIGHIEGFEKSKWPIPIFGRILQSVPGAAWLVRFAEDRIGYGAPREEWPVTVDEARKYPEEAVWGVDVAAFNATKRLSELEKLN